MNSDSINDNQSRPFGSNFEYKNLELHHLPWTAIQHATGKLFLLSVTA